MKEENKEAMIEDEESTTSKAYCSCKFLLGITLMLIAAILMFAMLPFIDLTLNAAFLPIGIITSLILSIVILKERFIAKYDLTALLFISIGSILMVL